MDLIAGEVVEEWQGDGAGRGFFGDGEVAGFGVEALGDEGLEVDGGEIIAAVYAVIAEEIEKLVALGLVEFVGEAEDIDEPAHLAIGWFFGGDESRFVGQQLVIPLGDPAAFGDHLVESF